MEIERKFLVRDPAAELPAERAEPIRQGYLAVDGDGIEVRVRERAGRATLTVKQGLGLVRLEEEISIGRERFGRLWPLTEGRRIEKVRHLLPVDGATLEVDVYGGALAGLVVAEVEFGTVAESEAFAPPAWLGDEVTGDPRYVNRALAVDGWPDGRPAYRLDDHGDVPRRVVQAQLDKAIGGLEAAGDDDLAEAVHSARKSLKRVRSALRLGRDVLGDDVYRRENEAVRDAGRRLSGARDSQVMVDTLDALLDRHRDELPPQGFAGLRARAGARSTARRRRACGPTPARSPTCSSELRAVRRRTAAWDGDGRDLAALGPGLARAYRRGRKTLRAAAEETGDEALHDLRKRVKDLWYMSELVRPASPKRAKKLATRASDLSDVIGEDHDLAVLRETADRHSGRLTATEFDLLDDLIARRRADLQAAGARRGGAPVPPQAAQDGAPPGARARRRLARRLDDPDVVAVRVAQAEHHRRAGRAHQLVVDVDAADRLQPLVLAAHVGGLDADRAAAGRGVHRRVQRQARAGARRGHLEPAALAVLAEAHVGTHLVAELRGVEAERRVLVGDGEHRDADVGHGGGGGLRGIAHVLKTVSHRGTHRGHRQVLVLGHELGRRERRALRVGDDGHPDPRGVERRDEDRAAELGRLLRDRVGVVDGERQAPVRGGVSSPIGTIVATASAKSLDEPICSRPSRKPGRSRSRKSP